jgi:Mg-chelatase subunit ChlD
MRPEDEPNPRLKRVLDSLGTTYGSDEVDVVFGERAGYEDVTRSYRDTDVVLPADVESHLDADLSRTEQYEILLDTLNHLSVCQEVESPERTEAFVSSTTHPDSLSGFVHRMVEHAHITSTRLAQYRGLAGPYARRMAVLFDDETTPRVDDLRTDTALLEGLHQLAYTGRVNGLEDAPAEVRGPLAAAAAELNGVRDPGVSPDDRDATAERILELLSDRLYRPATAERYVTEEMTLPFEDFSEIVPELEDPTDEGENADDDWQPSDVFELLALVWYLPLCAPLQRLGYEDTIESFFGRLPDGPHGMAWPLYVFLFPVFVGWALVRGVAGRLGVWESIVTGARSGWDRVVGLATTATAPFGRLRTRLDSGLRTAGESVGSACRSAVSPVNRRLPEGYELTTENLESAYWLSFMWPYAAVGLVHSEAVDAFGDRLEAVMDAILEPVEPLGTVVPDPVVSAAKLVYLAFFPPVLLLLFPVFVLWVVTRTLGRALGVWEGLVAAGGAVHCRVRRLWRTILSVPALCLGLLAWLSAALVGLWRRLAYALRRDLRRLGGDDWRRDLPTDADADRLARALDDIGGDRETPDDDTGTSTNGDGTASEPERVGDKRDPGVADATAGTLAGGDRADRLLEASDGLSTTSPGTVSIVDPETDEGELAEALRDLSRVDRRTKSELQGLRAERDARVSSTGDADAVFEEMSARGLDDTIRELFSMFPPEERRDVRARTGHRFDVRPVVESAGGRLDVGDGPFRRRQHATTGTRCVGVAIDLSGSMNVFEAKVSLAAVATATDLVDDTFTAVGFRRGSTPLVTGPNEPFDREHLTAVGEGGNTPMAAGIREARRLLKASNENERTLVVVTDGDPTEGLDGGDGAYSDAAAQVEQCRRDDIPVVGVGIGTGATSMERVFGENGYTIVDDGAFAERLVEVYRDQLLRTRQY